MPQRAAEEKAGNATYPVTFCVTGHSVDRGQDHNEGQQTNQDKG
jgi:hypothetical protein